MVCKMFIFRHAETFDNKNGVFSGWRDSDLTLKGISQAHETAEQLKQQRIDYAFTSHLKRARRTLEIVLQNHPSVPVFTDDRLIERCYGTLQGKNKKKMERENPEWYAQIHRGYSAIPPEGESLEMVEKRVLSFLKQLKEWLKQNPGNVAISCHNNSIRPFRQVFEDLSIAQLCKIDSPHNQALIYQIQQSNNGTKCPENITPKTRWKGIVLSEKVNLATDPRNLLKDYYK